MKIVIDIPESKYLSLKKCFENDVPLGKTDTAIINGTPLPEGAEILTAEAYSDLCLQASNGCKTGRWVLAEMGDTDLYECSLCKTRKTYKPPFCPQCGAKMEEEGAKE